MFCIDQGIEREYYLIFQASEDQLGTDEEAIAEILTTRSRPHLNAVFEEFKQVSLDVAQLRTELLIF